MSTTYSKDQLDNMISTAWQNIITANAGLCVNNGWHLEVSSQGTTLVLMYTDCDDKANTYRIIL